MGLWHNTTTATSQLGASSLPLSQLWRLREQVERSQYLLLLILSPRKVNRYIELHLELFGRYKYLHMMPRPSKQTLWRIRG